MYLSIYRQIHLYLGYDDYNDNIYNIVYWILILFYIDYNILPTIFILKYINIDL